MATVLPELRRDRSTEQHQRNLENRRKYQESLRAKGRDLPRRKVVNPKRRKSAEEDDGEWLRTYMPEVFFNPFTADQEMQIHECGQALKYGTRACIAAPRGDGKTSIIKCLGLKYVMAGQVSFPLIIEATGPKASEVLSSIKARIASPTSTELFEDYPLICDVARYVNAAPLRAKTITVGGKPVLVEWKADRIILPQYEEEGYGPIYMALGITSDSLQGCNVYDRRPDFVMMNDLDNRDSLAAEDGKVAGKIQQLIDKTVAGLGGPTGRLGQAMLCTITSKDAAAFRYSDPSIKPAWSGRRVSRIKTWPKGTGPLKENGSIDSTKPDEITFGLWDTYIDLRQRGKAERDEKTNKSKDIYGREAFRYYKKNRKKMDAGAEMSNPYDFNQQEMPDGTPEHLSALQKCFDYIADNGLESFLTEHQNDPPDDPNVEQTILTAHRVKYGCRSGLEKGIVPAGTEAITCGLDIKKTGFHYVAIAWDATPLGCIIDYGFHEIQTLDMEMRAVERAILFGLHEWRETRDSTPYLDEEGTQHFLTLTAIDEGWKHEDWAGQPARQFVLEAENGLFERFITCKGKSPYTEPRATKNVDIGDNWNISLQKLSPTQAAIYGGKIPIIIWNSDLWKQKVHDGFLSTPPEPGSLTLFEPHAGRNRRQQPHMGFSKHLTSEVWERRFQPGFQGYKEGWWKIGSLNHYFDATAQACMARSVCGLSVLGSSRGTEAPQQQQPRTQVASMAQQGQTTHSYGISHGVERERNW